MGRTSVRHLPARRAAEQRYRRLFACGARQSQVQRDHPNRIAALREVERRAVGKEIAARSGQVFVSSPRNGMRGRVELHAAPGGVSYAVVSDGSRLAVMRTTTSLRALEGKSVILARDSRGQCIVRRNRDREVGR